MTIQKNSEGAWVISAIAGGYLVTQVYHFYTKREAVSRFKAHIKEIKGRG